MGAKKQNKALATSSIPGKAHVRGHSCEMRDAKTQTASSHPGMNGQEQDHPSPKKNEATPPELVQQLGEVTSLQLIIQSNQMSLAQNRVTLDASK